MLLVDVSCRGSEVELSLSIMAFTQVLLLQLLLVSLALASHHMGGKVTYTVKEWHRNGMITVDFHNKDTFDRCSSVLHWNCYQGNCGQSVSTSQTAIIDKSTNAPSNERLWCETERVQTRRLTSNKPFYLRASSCCWISTRNSVEFWRHLTYVDLGIRSDTKEPNRAPDYGILPFLRVPQNCPRTYKLVNFDPDGDKVRCRYGNIPNLECSRCDQPPGFHLNQETCVLQYNSATYDYRIYGFEMMVEDFPQRPVTLTYSDGSQSVRAPPSVRKKRQWYNPTTTAAPWNTTPWYWGATTPWYWQWTTTAPPTTTAATTTSPTTTAATTTSPTTTAATPLPFTHLTVFWNFGAWNFRHPAPTTTAATTTTSPTTTAAPTTTTAAPTTTTYAPTTTTAAPTTTTTAAPTTTTYAPTTTTAAPYTTTAAPTTTTAAPTTTTAAPTTAAPTTTTAAPTTTTAATTTTTAAPTTTTAATTTTTAAPTTTTAAPTTTTAATTTTTAAPTTTTTYTTTTAPYTTTYATTTALNFRPQAMATGRTMPFSKLPVQFSLLVDKPVPSCQPGQYLPEYVVPTPINGAHIHAEIKKEVEIRVKARTAFSVIDDIVLSGPQNMRKQKVSKNEFVITWTPKDQDLGNHYVICFAVEAKKGYSIYQGDMRCVIVDVERRRINTNVICKESYMRVEIEKASCPEARVDHLRLSDSSNVICSLKTHSNKTHFIAVTPLNGCGTQIEEDDNFLIFENEVTTFDNLKDLVTRKPLLEVKFNCRYPKRGNVTQSFMGHRKSVTVWDKGMGKFTYQFEFYPNVQFGTMLDPNSYPLEYDLGNRIYMQIEATSTVNNTELFVESCRAAPYDNPNYKPVYTIIENGCKVDPTVQIHSAAHGRQFRFSMEAFKFIGLHDQVYISCSVLVCRAGDPDTRCAKGCINPPPMNTNSRRRKREVVTQSSTHLVSQGPLRLARSAERADSSAMNLNLVFIVGCLLAAVGMISGVVLYKAKISTVKYQPLPTFEK